MMVSEDLKQLASLNIQDLFGNRKVEAPISAFDLLIQVLSIPSASSSKAAFRLTDLHKLEDILEELSESWDAGTLSVLRDDADEGLTVMHVQLDRNPGADAFGGNDAFGAGAQSKKRKRQVDEDADSAEEEEARVKALSKPKMTTTASPCATTLNSLSKDVQEIYAVLQRGTARGKLLAEEFRSQDAAFEPICPHITKDECAKSRQAAQGQVQTGDSTSTLPPSSFCARVHFRPLIRPHTDPSLGHCSYLNTCYSEPTYAQSPSIPPFPSGLPRPPTGVSLPSGLGAGGRGKEKAPCRYVHFEVDWDPGNGESAPTNGTVSGRPHKLGIGLGPTGKETSLLPPQWINCDIRRFDHNVLGKFHAIMADPPWDIHMSLPYGTMTDDEMKSMPIPDLQDEGLLFLWVTGRAMEIGRECMRVWGYTRVDEVIWIKTNQLQRVIRTGRTGHWLNHTKEHMLVGVKNTSTNFDPSTGTLKFPAWCNRGLDTDVIVSEVRETSRKPDEVYSLIERMCPGGRKLEIFGRKHNARPGWLTLGNQLGTDRVVEEELEARIRARYPERMLNVGPGVPIPQGRMM